MSGADGGRAGSAARSTSEPIAIVGIGCRYADARGPSELYEIVRARRNTVRDAPAHRVELGYDIEHFYDPRPRIPGKISSKKAGFLEHPELFDPEAFGIAPRDALTMEPQQRLMIEVTWDALDDAGIPIDSIAGERVAVILGYMAEDYSRERAGVLGEAAVYRGHDVFTVGGMSHAVLSGRISFLLGTTGPSLTLDTACSSSLYAAHLACESLRRGESKLAITGGVNLFLSPEGNIALSRSGMLSLSGACRAFDAKADGFVRAEGAGIVVLRPLRDALAAGNPIYAVIRGSGISADGRDGGHMMAPGRKGQAQAMRDAYAMAGISPADVHYVETHGTGTMIGDPVEIGALADVMGPGRRPDRKLRVASIKGNLGHTESASGIAGLINAALAIRHRTLPPQLHFETPSPVIPWAEIPIEVQREAEPWPFPERPLVGVNSFGISGTNAHFILEAPPEAVASTAHARSTGPLLIPISAHSPNALHALAQALRDRLAADPALDLRDLAYTLSRRRSQRAHRLALVAASADEAREILDAWLAGEASPELRIGTVGSDAKAPLVMVFPGQGSQWLGMGRQLLRESPCFAAAIDRIDAAYRDHVAWSLRAVLEGRPARAGGLDADWTERLDVLQPVLVAVEVALAGLWRHFGIEPKRVLGQSMGELAAAHVAGALSLADMARLACARGRVVARAAGHGTMAVVSLPAEVVARRLEEGPGGVEIAGTSSPSTTILSGDRREVVALVDVFESEGVFARRLDVDFASHCFHMDPLVEPFREAVGEVVSQSTAIAFDSTVDGATRSGETLDTDYWLRNLRQAVVFDRGLGASLAGGGSIFLEVSPHPALPRAIDETAQSLGHAVRYVSSLRRGEDEARCLLRSLAELFVRGVDPDWSALHPEGRVVALPLYPYQRTRYFFSRRTRLDTFRPTHPLLGARVDSSLDPRLHSWDFPLDADSGSFLLELREAGNAAGNGLRRAPDALVIELALAAGESLWPGRPIALTDLRAERPLELAADGRRWLQLHVREESDGRASLSLASRERVGDDYCLHATATLDAGSATGDRAGRDGSASISDADRALVRDGSTSLSVDEWHAALERSGRPPGPNGRVLRELEAQAGGSGVVGKLMLPRTLEAEWYAYHAHPLLVESALQLAGALFETHGSVDVRSIERIELAGRIGSDCLCRVRRRSAADGASARTAPTRPGTSDRLVADVDFFDRQGAWLGRIGGLAVEARPLLAGARIARSSEWNRIDWRAADARLLEAPREVDRFILVSDSEANAAWLAAELDKQGVEVRFCEKTEDLEPLVRFHRATGDGRYGFLLLAWADRGEEAAPEPALQREYRVGQWATVIREHTADAQQIWIATRGLQARCQDAGLAPHVAREIDSFASCAEMQQCRLFDARPTLGELDLDWLAALLGRPGPERQFVMGEEGARVARLAPLVCADEADANGAASGDAGVGLRAAGEHAYRAQATGREGRGALAFEVCAEPALAPDEVRVEVSAASLSGFDVLTGLGLGRAPGLGSSAIDGVAAAATADGANALGLDFAGVVVEVGREVADLVEGQRVVGLRRGALARRLVVPRRDLIGVPDARDPVALAAEAWPKLVADHVLRSVARLRAGERVLVVSAGGGVGLALVRLAHALGAEVLATASRPERREAFVALGGRDFDAQTLPGAAFDVIVSAESGAALHARLRLLAPGGRYIDLCPRERFVRPEIGALRLGANRSYLPVDCLAALEADGLGFAQALARTTSETSPDATNALPFTSFPIAEASRALRFMTQNRHTGRIVLDFAGAAQVGVRGLGSAMPRTLAGRSFVVTATAGSERAGEARAALVRWLETEGAWEAEGPEADADAWIHLCDEASPAIDPLRHRMAASSVPERFLLSLREAMVGEADRDRSWEARLWIDRLLLAGARSGEGRAIGVSLGSAATAERIVRAFERLWRARPVDDQWVELPAEELSERSGKTGSPLLDGLVGAHANPARQAFDRAGFLALSPPERRATLLRHVCDELAGVLALSSERREALDPTSRLDGLGLDSLMSMELFMGLGRSLELTLAADWFPAGPSLAEIAQVLVRRLEASLASTSS